MKAALFSFSILLSILPVLLTAQTTPRNIGVVDVTKVFDEYYKVKIAKERMAKSQKIFREEMEIFQTELKKLAPPARESVQQHQCHHNSSRHVDQQLNAIVPDDGLHATHHRIHDRGDADDEHTAW